MRDFEIPSKSNSEIRKFWNFRRFESFLDFEGRAILAQAAAPMPSPLQWRRARAIHSLFKDLENADSSLHRLVFAFCDCPPQVLPRISKGSAFALLADWGAVVTWGHADEGGDSSLVAAQLSGGVQTVVGNSRAFAAVKVDGSVVTWGYADWGGDSRGVAAQLSGGVDCWRVLPDLADGAIVLLVGLQRAELNGRRAVVRQPVVPSKPSRVGVEVAGKIVAIKRENLESI